MLSSVLPSLYLFFLLCFLFQLLFSSVLTSSFFIFSSSLLKFLLCSSILYPNSVSILIVNALSSLCGQLFISVLLFFQGFSFDLSIETNSPVFSFCLYFSVSMKLGERIPYGGLEGGP